MKRVLFIITLILQLIKVGISQRPYTPTFSDPLLDKYRWRQYDELSGKGFTCFYEDKNGVMWFGVKDGVMSFDGYKWSEYLMSKEEQRFGRIRCMEFIGDTLFIFGHGIKTFVNGEWGANQYKIEQEYFFKDMFVNGTLLFHYITKNKQTLIGATTYGIYIRQNGKEHFYTNQIVKQRQDTLFKDLNFHVIENFGSTCKYFFSNILDCGNNSYYAFYSGETKRKKHFKFRLTDSNENPLEIIHEDRLTDISTGGPVASICRDNGEIWLVSESWDKGLNILRNNEWKEYMFEDLLNDSEISCHIIELTDKSVLITSMGVIYRYYNGEWTKITTPDIPFKSIHLYAELTKDGDLWLGDEKGEIYRIDYSSNHWTTYKDLNYQFTNSDGSLWFISKQNEIVYKKDNKWYYFDNTDALPSAPQTLYKSKNGIIWCGGSHNSVAATAYLQNNKWNMQVHDSLSWSVNYNAVTDGNDGAVWFGGASNPKTNQNGGLVKIEINENKANVTTYQDYKNRSIYHNSFAQASGTSIYSATNNGLYMFNNGQLIAVNKVGENYNRIIKTNSGALWIATSGSGILKYVGNKKTGFSLKKGLPTNVIFDIYARSDTSVWIATSKGFSYYNGHFWVNDIYPEEFNIDTESGKLSGTNKNIWISKFPLKWTRRVYEKHENTTNFKNFFSVMYKRDTMPPETQIVYYKHEVDDSGSTNIQWRGVDYKHHTPKQKLLYSYRLNNNEWTEPDRATNINLSGLKQGDYIFEVRAVDNDLNYDYTPAKVSFTVIPPVWKRTWFIFMLLFFLAIIIFLITRIILRNNKLAALNNNLMMANTQIQESKEEIMQQTSQLYEANKLLEKQHTEILSKNEEIYQLKIRFFTNISHEFRTPLSLIIAPIEELSKSENFDRKQKYLFRTVQKNVRNLLKLVDQLMDFRKIDNKKFKLQVSNANLFKVISEIASGFNFYAKTHHIKFKLNTNEAQDTEYWFDTNIIEKVLMNLLSNAFKFTPKGGKIVISVHRKNNLVNISVADSGKGINKDKINYIFDRFYSDPTGSNELQTSTGIGLAMCKRLIEIHKGSIAVESEEGKGTIFNVQIPVSKNTYSHEEVKKSVYSDKTSEISTDIQLNDTDLEDTNWNCTTKKDESILMLIVEDNEELREYLTMHFGYYKIKSAINGAEAFEIAKETIPDIIITDLMMPEMNGLQLCSKIKTTNLTSHIPVILLTAKAHIENHIEGLETGADAYISKPFNMHHLEIQVKNLIKQRKTLREKFAAKSEDKLVDIAISDPDAELLKIVEEIVSKEMANPDFNADSLAQALFFSRSQLDRKLKAITNCSPSKFIRMKRLECAAELIKLKKHKISQIAFEVGFFNPDYFYTAFKKQFGKTPKEYENDISQYHSEHRNTQKSKLNVKKSK